MREEEEEEEVKEVNVKIVNNTRVQFQPLVSIPVHFNSLPNPYNKHSIKCPIQSFPSQHSCMHSSNTFFVSKV